MKNFENLQVWQEAVQLAVSVYKVVKTDFPDHERFGLSSQIRRAVVSISSNIAEGCSRNSDNAISNYLQIALGSSNETYTQLIIAEKIGYISKEKNAELLDDLNSLQKMIVGYMKHINKPNNPNT